MFARATADLRVWAYGADCDARVKRNGARSPTTCLRSLRVSTRRRVRPATVKAAYEFAARHPEILTYVPCFCGCERLGHKGNEDCFVAKRDDAGRVTEWVPHGMVCETCIDVATQAMKMHAAGATIPEIRAAVEAEYRRPGGSETPTPMAPPPGGGHQ